MVVDLSTVVVRAAVDFAAGGDYVTRTATLSSSVAFMAKRGLSQI
jgi:hypothetical protein